MYDIPTYKHPKRKQDPEEEHKPSFFHHAAKFSLWTPIVAGVVVAAVTYSLKGNVTGSVMHGVSKGAVFAYMASLGLGVFALLGIIREGIRGILIPAAIGIVISGMALGYFGQSFVREIEARLKRHELTARARTTKDQADAAPDEPADGKDLASKNNSRAGGTDAADTANLPPEKQGAAEKAKTGSSREGSQLPNRGATNTTLLGKALYIHQAKQQTIVTAYDAAALALKTPPVLGLKDVNQREQLEAKKALINKFLDANEKLLGFSTKAETDVRIELVKLQASPATIDEGLKDYRQSMGDRDFIALQMRATDQRAGKAMLTMLDLLETNWGGWKYDLQKNKLSFQDVGEAVKYNDSLNEMNAAAAEKAGLQAKLPGATTTASSEVKPSI